MGLIRRRRAPKGRRRRAFSLNGLAIQLSAFALSFTLVALLVVSGSQAAFVEENQIVTDHVPLGLPEQEDGARTRSPSPSPSPVPAAPTPGTAPLAAEVAPQVAEPASVPIELTDSDEGTAMFGFGTVLSPGAALDRCISVTYDGKGDADPVRLYAAEVSGDLAPYLDLVVDMGAAGGDESGGCADYAPVETLYRGTMAGFGTDHADYGSGLPTWQPHETGDARRFRFSVSLRDDPAAEGAAVRFGFTWETRAE